jgi:hypothetical protein
MCLEQGLATFSGKSQIVNILGLAGHGVSVTTACFCLYRMKLAIDKKIPMNEPGCVPVKLDLQKQMANWICPGLVWSIFLVWLGERVSMKMTRK